MNNFKMVQCRSKPTFASLSVAGFSLVEVTLALAIAALGILTVMGLLPSSINNVATAGRTITASRIYSQMLGELQSMDWGTYTGGFPGWTRLELLQSPSVGSRRFFDVEGTRLQEGGNLDQSYIAEFFFPAEAVWMTGGAVPAGDTRIDMRRVIIRIAMTPSAEFDFSNPAAFEQRAFTIARGY